MSSQLILRSPLLDRHGFAHGFSLRTGGVSAGALATLNLGRNVGDDPASVAENARRFAEAVGLDLDRLYEVSQVHGRTVATAAGSVLEVRRVEADALVATSEGASVGVRTADCVPILLAHPRTGAVAAVHAGWRGVVAYVLAEALHRLAPEREREVCAAIGPHIRVESFEIGKDVASEIASAAHGVKVIEARAPRPHADLAKAIAAQLAHAGVPPEQIDDVGGCTLAEPERFFSHRRDGGHTGRHLSAISARGKG